MGADLKLQFAELTVGIVPNQELCKKTPQQVLEEAYDHMERARKTLLSLREFPQDEVRRAYLIHGQVPGMDGVADLCHQLDVEIQNLQR